MGCFETAIPKEDREPELDAKNFRLVKTGIGEGRVVVLDYKDLNGDVWWILAIDKQGKIVRYSAVSASIGLAVTADGVVKMSKSV